MALIKVENYSKRFGHKTIHENVNFQIYEGECLGLIGGSGTGKSVLLRSLIGLEKADSGHIYIDNIDINTMNETELIPVRKKVAYVFQNGALFDSMTVYENLAYPLRAHSQLAENQIRDKIERQLNEFGLLDALGHFPSELSGGMQKRVGLARAIMLDPEVILYDEPTAGLDPGNTLNIQDLILRLKKKGRTSILVTHDMPTAIAVCDRFIILKNKTIGEEGKSVELLAQPDSLLNQFIQGNML